MMGRAIGHDGLDGLDIIAHGAVANGARAAAIVAGHAADGRPARCGDVDHEHQSVVVENAVQLIERDPRLNGNALVRRIEVNDLIEMFADVDDQRFADGLAALRGAAAARQDGNVFVARDLHGGADVIFVFWHYHPDGLYLIVRRIGAVTTPAEGIEQHVSLNFPLKPPRQGAVANSGVVVGEARGGARMAVRHIAGPWLMSVKGVD